MSEEMTSTLVIDTDAIRHHWSAVTPSIRPDSFIARLADTPDEDSDQRCVHVLSFTTRNRTKIVTGIYSADWLAREAAGEFIKDMGESKIYRHDEEPHFRWDVESKPVGQSVN